MGNELEVSKRVGDSIDNCVGAFGIRLHAWAVSYAQRFEAWKHFN